MKTLKDRVFLESASLYSPTKNRMIQHKIKIRVRYGETDRMGYVYYGNYATYFEVARVEGLRELGINYKDLEEDGVMLPVLEFKIKYYKPAYYDDELTIVSTVSKMPGVRIHFTYQTFNQKGDLLNEAETTLVFVDTKTQKPVSIPEDLRFRFQPFFH
jgi:acyl-CoA thioester hydrolase